MPSAVSASAPVIALGTLWMVPAPTVLYVASGTCVTSLTTAADARPLACEWALVPFEVTLTITNTPITSRTATTAATAL